jgi:hypothetical protein
MQQLNQVVRHLRGMLANQEAAGMPDADLLKRYVHQRDETAFEILVPPAWADGPRRLPPAAL